MSEVLSRAQPYIQLEEAMKTSFNYIMKHGDIEEKLKFSHEVSAHAQDRNRGNLPSKNNHSQSSLQVHSEPSGQNNISLY